MDAVHTEGLKRSFGEVKALRGLDLDVPSGSLFGLLGPNGAGKTTTIRILATLIRPGSGTASIFGHDVVKDQLAVKERIGLMVEHPGFYPHMTVEENILTHASFYGIRSPQQRAKERLKEVGMYRYRDRLAEGLSYGMKKRLAIAQSLISNPELLLLDEPMTGLDPEGIAHVRDILKEVNAEGTTIFMSTHMISEVDMICDRVAILRRGRVLVQGRTEEVKSLLPEGAGMCIEFQTQVKDPNVLEEMKPLGTVTWAPNGFAICPYGGSLEDVAAKVNDILVDRGMKVFGINQREVRLEDAYLDIMMRRRKELKRRRRERREQRGKK